MPFAGPPGFTRSSAPSVPPPETRKDVATSVHRVRSGLPVSFDRTIVSVEDAEVDPTVRLSGAWSVWMLSARNDALFVSFDVVVNVDDEFVVRVEASEY